VPAAGSLRLFIQAFSADESIMSSNVSHALGELNTRYHALGKSARLGLFTLLILLMSVAAASALRPAAIPDLAEANHARKANFFSLWDRGDVVVLMRHAERCDHSSNPCLDQSDGITVKGRQMAQQVGLAFKSLGLNQLDVYNSPLRRTEQTSAYAFNRTSTAEDWLVNCRKTMLADVLKHKLDHRNMVLVTHSECVAALEQSLNTPVPSSIAYGSSLVVSIDPDTHATRVLGFVDAQDWGKVLAKRS
jgi:phosphohistidine phosphatase SixA